MEVRYRLSHRDRRPRLSEQVLLPENGASVSPSSHDEERLVPQQDIPRIGNPQNFLSTPPLSVETNTTPSDDVQEPPVTVTDNRSISSFANTDLYQPSIIDVSTAHSSRQPQSVHPVQSNPAPTSYNRNVADCYLGETGFVDVYGPETRLDADGQVQHRRQSPEILDVPPPELQQVFEETYFDFCYTWCPVLDRDTLADELTQSPLLANALALAGSHVQPPMILCAGPAAFYERVKQMFYGDKEEDLVMCLKAIALIYWWSPRAPSRVHRDSSWWWTTVAIRHAQHGGFHREPKPGKPSRSNINPGLRRRIWWTLFVSYWL